MRSDQRDGLLKLRSLARAGGHLETAAVRVLGLDEIEAAAGENWPRIRERVFAGSLHLIEGLLEENDTAIPCGEGFLLVFADAASDEIEHTCEYIREALTSFYLGEDGLAALRAAVHVQSLSLDAAQLSISGMAPAPPATQSPANLLESQPVELAPLWSLRNYARAATLCAAVIPGPHGPYVGYDADFLLRGVHERRDFLATDLLILDRALALQQEARTDAPQFPLGVQVHASTMQRRRTRETYLSWLPSAHDASPASFVTIAEIALGTPMISISEWVALLRPHFPHVVLDFHYTDHAIGAVRDTGAWAVSTHLPVYSAAQRSKLATPTLAHLQFWTQAIHGRGMRLIVHGFQEPAFAAQAAKLGVDFGTGKIPSSQAEPLTHVGARADNALGHGPTTGAPPLTVAS